MPSQEKLDTTFMAIADQWGQMSRARRKQVGCIIVKNGQVISNGYNGTPHGFDNDCEYPSRYGWETKAEVIHAESNAITKLAKSTQSSEGATMYITVSPCFDCAKLIIQSDIERVVFGEVYRDSSGVMLLKKANIEVNCLDYVPG